MIIDPTVIAIPVYFLLIGIELIVHRIQAVKSYRLNDAVTNINCGVTSQVTGAFLKVLSIGAYTFIYEEFAVTQIPNSVLVWILAFIAYDFFYYWAHRMSHQVNLFWGGHSVHHQSEDYNLSVALRQSSTQVIWTFIFYIPMAIAGINPIILVSVSGFNLLYQFWIHTEAINKLPKWFEAIFNTPSHHRVHHARNPKYIDKNHAGTLIIWDKIFGTFKEEEERPVYGITKNINSWNPVWANVAHYSDMMKEIKTIPHWSDRFRYIFYKPGWLPEYMGGYISPTEVDKTIYQKYDVKSASSLNLYVLVHYIILLAGTALFLFNIDKITTVEKIAFAAAIILSVISFGGLFENRSWSLMIEILRLIATPLALLYAFVGTEIQLWQAIAAISFILVFGIWLMKARRLPLPANP